MRKIVLTGRGLCSPKIYGIHRNTIEILRCLDHMVEPGQIALLIPADEPNTLEFKNIQAMNIGKSFSRFGMLGARVTSFLYRNWYFRNYVRKSKALSVDMVLIFPHFGCDVVSIYDCIPDKFPQYYMNKQSQRVRKKVLKKQAIAVNRCKVVLTDSENAKQDIRTFYDISNKPVEVIPCGWQHFNRIEEDDSIIERLGLTDKPFFFSLGSRLPHKNILWINHAARQNPQYRFIVSGSTSARMEGESFEGKALPNVTFAGYLSDAEVKALMRRCKAFIQPSLYEGFGIPPMEAMSVGADCIVSNVSSLPEVYKNSVWYIDPSRYDHIDLDEIMSRPKESNEVILNQYNWEKSAKKLWSILQKLAGESNN